LPRGYRQKNLELIYGLVKRDIDSNGLGGVRLTTTLNQREAVTGAKYVFSVARVGGLPAFETDIEIPLRYGIDQCVGDTICAGGIMYGQRTIPFILELCRDIREVGAPGAMLLNYSNPMAMNTWAANLYGEVPTVGLCHGVQHGHQQIAEVLGLKQNEVDIICAGINHQTWYIQVRHDGKDMTGELLEAFERHPVFSKQEKVRIDMLRRFGYYSTESNGHLSEYVPWYRKRPDEIAQWIDLSEWIHGETGVTFATAGSSGTPSKRSTTAGARSRPMSTRASGAPRSTAPIFSKGSRPGVPTAATSTWSTAARSPIFPRMRSSRSPATSTPTGVSIPIVGDLPLGPAAVCNASVSVQRLAVEAAVRGNDQLLRQAMMMDPLVGAVCNPPEIWQMVDEMLVAQAGWLPQYSEAVERARRGSRTASAFPPGSGRARPA